MKLYIYVDKLSCLYKSGYYNNVLTMSNLAYSKPNTTVLPLRLKDSWYKSITYCFERLYWNAKVLWNKTSLNRQYRGRIKIEVQHNYHTACIIQQLWFEINKRLVNVYWIQIIEFWCWHSYLQKFPASKKFVSGKSPIW